MLWIGSLLNYFFFFWQSCSITSSIPVNASISGVAHSLTHYLCLCLSLGGFGVIRSVLLRNPCCVSQCWCADFGKEDVREIGSLCLPSKKSCIQWSASNTEHEWLKAFDTYSNFRWHSSKRTDFLIMTMHSVITAWDGGTVQRLDEELYSKSYFFSFT